jgi:arabinofuranosyltransferase
VYYLWGLSGTAQLVQPRSPLLWKRVISKAGLVSIAMVLFVFWVIGGRAYGRDVAIIESEMVGIAQWVAENTEAGALIAAHDIGALGFFGNRKLIDLAGLVSPDVIPFIRDEGRLAEYLNEQEAEYLVTFPGWYPELVRLSDPIYQSEGIFSPLQGGENMVIYRWRGKP